MRGRKRLRKWMENGRGYTRDAVFAMWVRRNRSQKRRKLFPDAIPASSVFVRANSWFNRPSKDVDLLVVPASHLVWFDVGYQVAAGQPLFGAIHKAEGQ